MDPLALSLVIGAMFFLLFLDRGREAEATRRCYACGTRRGEKHHRDCQWRDK